MYLRFAAARMVEGTSSRSGFFGAAYGLREQSDLDAQSRRELEEILAWFRANLPLPDRFNRTASKGYYRREITRGISWFKPTAKEHLAHGHRLAALLAMHGYPVDVIKTAKPGYVIYEDDHQIVAEPFADRPGF